MIEEFKSCLPTHIKTYLDECNAEGLHQAAVLAEDYSLTHKGTFSRDVQSIAGLKGTNSGGASGLTSNRPVNDACQFEGSRSNKSSVPVCFYCKKNGHVMADCWKREKKNVRPNSLAVPHHVQPTSGSGNVPLSPERQFNPFVSKGTVSLSRDGEQVPITILRDTGATQTLIVEGALPLSRETATGATMLIQGVGLAPVSVPLHTVYLRCGLVTGPVVVGARPSLPVQGISLLLGNDLAGSKVIPGLAVDNNPKLTKDVDKLDSLIPGLFPACAVIRAATRRAASQSGHTMQSEQSDGSAPSPQVADETMLKDVHNKGTTCTTDDHVNAVKSTREQLIQAQEQDAELRPLIDDVVSEEESS